MVNFASDRIEHVGRKENASLHLFSHNVSKDHFLTGCVVKAKKIFWVIPFSAKMCCNVFKSMKLCVNSATFSPFSQNVYNSSKSKFQILNQGEFSFY